MGGFGYATEPFQDVISISEDPMIGERVIKANKNLWAYLAAREAEDAARRAAASRTAKPAAP